eukprot:TRINITY_DN1752_c0_g2_i3.p1 TRINITY_DN1752_c0_g2~~TRINITY_DN1752_c0_g2_i3.p1  ORF type:complete len:465 (-),score=76.96 TRINITY_DN1752_c0_g2_i3:208-1524(-)
MFEWIQWQSDPMLQSVLAFSDANKFLNTTIQDLVGKEVISSPTRNKKLCETTVNFSAILTAAAAAQLHLNGSIVVLSACETYTGNVENVIDSEGLYCLCRGFKISQAKCIIASIWKVESKLNHTLLNHFYEELLKGRYVAKALEIGQSQIGFHGINIRDWGGIICLGSIEALGSEENSCPTRLHQSSNSNYIIHEHTHCSEDHCPDFTDLSRDIDKLMTESTTSSSFHIKVYLTELLIELLVHPEAGKNSERVISIVKTSRGNLFSGGNLFSMLFVKLFKTLDDQTTTTTIPWASFLTPQIHNLCQLIRKLQYHLKVPTPDQSTVEKLMEAHKASLFQLACVTPGESVCSQLLNRFHKSGLALVETMLSTIPLNLIDAEMCLPAPKEPLLIPSDIFLLTEKFFSTNKDKLRENLAIMAVSGSQGIRFYWESLSKLKLD